MKKKFFFSGSVVIEVPRKFLFDFLANFDKNIRWIEESVKEDSTINEYVLERRNVKQNILIHGSIWHYKKKYFEFRGDEYLKVHLVSKKEKIELEYILTNKEYSKTLLMEAGIIVTEGTSIHKWLTGFNKSTMQKRLQNFKEAVEKEYKTI